MLQVGVDYAQGSHAGNGVGYDTKSIGTAWGWYPKNIRLLTI